MKNKLKQKKKKGKKYPTGNQWLKCRALALQTQGPESKSKYCQKEKLYTLTTMSQSCKSVTTKAINF
jgi:hypothetical protein